MSIYATLWTMKFPLGSEQFPDCDWIEVRAQAVPAHVGSPSPGQGYEDGDPFADFLPQAVEVDPEGDAPHPRAVVIVTEHTKKGTDRSGQEYEAPLLVLSGREYDSMTFAELHARIRDALHAVVPPDA